MRPDSGEVEYAHRRAGEAWQVLYTSRQTVQWPLTAGVSFNTAGMLLADMHWTAPRACESAPAEFCRLLGRHECFDHNVCGPCFFGLAASSEANNSMCVVNTPAAGSAVAVQHERYSVALPPNGSVLQFSAGGWGVAGLVSEHSFMPCSQVAGVRFVANSTAQAFMVGLVSGASDFERVLHYAELDFALYLRADGLVSIYEKGSHRFFTGRGYTSGDEFQVRHNPDNGVVEYVHEGDIVYTSTRQPQFPLAAGVSVGHAGAMLANLEWLPTFTCTAAGVGDGDCSRLHRLGCVSDNLCGSCITGYKGTAGPSNADDCTVMAPAHGLDISWSAFRNVEFPAPRTVQTTSGGWNAGAVSAHALGPCDNFVGVSFTVPQRANIMVGLNHGPHVTQFAHYSDLDHALYVRLDGSLSVYESGSHRFQAQVGYAGDTTTVFEVRVDVRSGRVTYHYNGVVLYVSPKLTLYPLSMGLSFHTPGSAVANLSWVARPADAPPCTTAAPTTTTTPTGGGWQPAAQWCATDYTAPSTPAELFAAWTVAERRSDYCNGTQHWTPAERVWPAEGPEKTYCEAFDPDSEPLVYPWPNLYAEVDWCDTQSANVSVIWTQAPLRPMDKCNYTTTTTTPTSTPTTTATTTATTTPTTLPFLSLFFETPRSYRKDVQGSEAAWEAAILARLVELLEPQLAPSDVAAVTVQPSSSSSSQALVLVAAPAASTLALVEQVADICDLCLVAPAGDSADALCLTLSSAPVPCRLAHCDSSPCQNGGTCMLHVDGYECACRSRNFGAQCQYDASACKGKGPCQHGGTCSLAENPNSFECACTPEWTGPTCDVSASGVSGENLLDGSPAAVAGVSLFAVLFVLGVVLVLLLVSRRRRHQQRQQEERLQVDRLKDREVVSFTNPLYDEAPEGRRLSFHDAERSQLRRLSQSGLSNPMYAHRGDDAGTLYDDVLPEPAYSELPEPAYAELPGDGYLAVGDGYEEPRPAGAGPYSELPPAGADAGLYSEPAFNANPYYSRGDGNDDDDDGGYLEVKYDNVDEPGDPAYDNLPAGYDNVNEPGYDNLPAGYDNVNEPAYDQLPYYSNKAQAEGHYDQLPGPADEEDAYMEVRESHYDQLPSAPAADDEEEDSYMEVRPVGQADERFDGFEGEAEPDERKERQGEEEEEEDAYMEVRVEADE